MAIDWNSPAVIARIRTGALRGVLKAAHLVVGEGSRLIIQGPKTGKVYRRRGVEHRASAPGEPPASDTGGLAGRNDVSLDAERVASRAHFKSAHARPLELGTPTIEPRPFARRALMNKQDEIRATIAAEIGKEL